MTLTINVSVYRKLDHLLVFSIVTAQSIALLTVNNVGLTYGIINLSTITFLPQQKSFCPFEYFFQTHHTQDLYGSA